MEDLTSTKPKKGGVTRRTLTQVPPQIWDRIFYWMGRGNRVVHQNFVKGIGAVSYGYRRPKFYQQLIDFHFPYHNRELEACFTTIPDSKWQNFIGSLQLNDYYKALLTAIVKKDKSGLLSPENQRHFFKALLNCFHPTKGSPSQVACVLQLCDEMGLVLQDLTAITEEERELFKFLTQPIVDHSEDSEALLLSRVTKLEEGGCSIEICQNIQASIRFSFKFLRGVDSGSFGFVYGSFAGADLCKVDLRKSKLPGANFFGANLCQAGLSGSSLSNANFADTSLRRAGLYDVNFRDAILARANLEGTSLQRTDFRGADLSEANFVHVTNFEGARFEGAKCVNCVVFDSSTNADSTLKLFEQAVMGYPEAIAPLIFSINAREMDKLNNDQIIRLKKLCMTCVRDCLARKTMLDLNYLFKLVSASKDNPFRYAPFLKIGVKDIYPEVIELIAGFYIKYGKKDKPFERRLIVEINKEKEKSFFNKGKWEELTKRIQSVKSNDMNGNPVNVKNDNNAVGPTRGK